MVLRNEPMLSNTNLEHVVFIPHLYLLSIGMSLKIRLLHICTRVATSATVCTLHSLEPVRRKSGWQHRQHTVVVWYQEDISLSTMIASTTYFVRTRRRNLLGFQMLAAPPPTRLQTTNQQQQHVDVHGRRQQIGNTGTVL
jgi:hypothetical protein